MMSGGWDSRTLLAAALAANANDLKCYTHGDEDSRELRNVRRLCEMSSVPLVSNVIDDSTISQELLLGTFPRVENAVFPHWHRAGTVLSAG
jgi:7-cyano-7-deazaguanine synthase in queuosine biosynthesis